MVTMSFMEGMPESHHKIYTVTPLTVDLAFQSLEATIHFLVVMTEPKIKFCLEEFTMTKSGLVATILVLLQFMGTLSNRIL